MKAVSWKQDRNKSQITCISVQDLRENTLMTHSNRDRRITNCLLGPWEGCVCLQV